MRLEKRFVAGYSRNSCQVQLGFLLHVRRRLFPIRCGTSMFLPKPMGCEECGVRAVELSSRFLLLSSSVFVLSFFPSFAFCSRRFPAVLGAPPYMPLIGVAAVEEGMVGGRPWSYVFGAAAVLLSCLLWRLARLSLMVALLQPLLLALMGRRRLTSQVGFGYVPVSLLL